MAELFQNIGEWQEWVPDWMGNLEKPVGERITMMLKAPTRPQVMRWKAILGKVGSEVDLVKVGKVSEAKVFENCKEISNLSHKGEPIITGQQLLQVASDDVIEEIATKITDLSRVTKVEVGN